ncbi:hypothetical protein [Pseudoalteromonas sp. T1lg23B]|uniref:hypothetical protein n=1 Tax=Pseudoalteromonas sp. T1lg23B TaxID=2077097 RepID=UPI000CF63416|nr:hypothetical protein [Pseudoalteromonas sp. T1lg23B]
MIKVIRQLASSLLLGLLTITLLSGCGGSGGDSSTVTPPTDNNSGDTPGDNSGDTPGDNSGDNPDDDGSDDDSLMMAHTKVPVRSLKVWRRQPSATCLQQVAVLRR